MAFDKNRKFLWCVFCGRTGKLTAEDIFGTTLADRFPVKHKWKTISAIGTVVRGGGPITRVASRLLCPRCNNELSGKIVRDSLPAMLRLIEGTSHEINAENRALLHRNFERMALILDVVTSNCQMTEKSKKGHDYRMSAPFRQAPPYYSDAQRKAWIEGEKLPGVHVYIGFHPGVLGLNPDVNTVALHGLAARQVRYPKTFLTTIGKLSVCIWTDGEPLSVPNSFRDLAVDQNWDWPDAVPAVSYEDFFGLYHPAPLHMAIVQLMSNPEWREQVEAYSRQIGSMELPPALEPEFTRMVEQAQKAHTLWRRGA